MKRYYHIFLLVCFLALSFNGFGQEKTLWLAIDKDDVSYKLLERKSLVKRYKTFKLDIEGLKSQLKTISNKSYKGKIIAFPDTKGELIKFIVKETSILHPDLAVKFPTIKSYSGQGLDDKSSTIHFTVNKLGLYAMILSPEKGTIYIDPYTQNRKKYMVYSKRDVSTNNSFECLTKNKSIKTTKSSLKNANDLKLRTFRLALATTEEYSNFHVDAAGIAAGSSRNDSITAVLSAITVTMVRVNAVFENDVGLTMQLVANNDQLIFLETDPGNDPYNNNDGPSMLTKNQTTIDNIIGIPNYDIGHVFSTGGGGVAFLRSPCGASKAGGVTGQSSPVGDTFDIDYVAHEMGHQYGANHTFNGTSNNCNGNRNNATAVEPGSGSTIMAYAGICSPQNVQSNSDAYFHVISIQEMFDNITIGNSQCADKTDFTANLNIPTADAGSDYTIPKSTPFILKGMGSDADGNQLTYCWEQIDNEVSEISIPPSSTQTVGAVFRSFSPSLDPDRNMPALSTIISGSISSTWEVIPSVSRTMDFLLTVRDNVISEGQTDSDDMTITVDDSAGPFIVTSQNTTGISWTMGSTQTITWDVAGTDSNDIDVSNVNILLSIDGGLTFPIELATNIDNDGQEDIIVPSSIAPNVRVMVEAIDNIFYAVNSEPFSIGSFETTCTIYDSNDIPKQIPDNNSSGITSIINVSDNFVVTDVNVNIDISHTWIRDLQIYLKSPDGTEVLLYDRSCGSGNVGKVNINAIFDDAATTTVCDNANPAISGITKSDNLLSTFNNVSSQGDWTLKIVDNAAQDTGTLNNWSVELCQTNATASVDDFIFKEFVVYPNPFNDSFTISLSANTSDDVIVTLYDISGRVIINKKFTNPNTTFKEEFNLNGLATGVYILNVRQGIAKASKKIVKY